MKSSYPTVLLMHWQVTVYGAEVPTTLFEKNNFKICEQNCNKSRTLGLLSEAHVLIARLVAFVVAEPGGGLAIGCGPARHPARHQWRLLLGGNSRVVSDWKYIVYLHRLIYYSVIRLLFYWGTPKADCRGRSPWRPPARWSIGSRCSEEQDWCRSWSW